MIKENNRIILNDNMKIINIKGSMWYCTVIFEDDQELKCHGELIRQDSMVKFIIYSIDQEVTREEKEIFIKLFNEDKKEHPNSFVELSDNFLNKL